MKILAQSVLILTFVGLMGVAIIMLASYLGPVGMVLFAGILLLIITFGRKG